MTPFSTSPLVSVIMPAYNSKQTIAGSVKSVIAQTYTHWELIVVDDGSTDNTAKVITDMNHPQIRVINQQNGGQSSARNHGIRLAKGDYIAFLDADDYWLEKKLDYQIRYFENASESVGLVHTNYIEFNDKREYSPKPLRHVKRHCFEGDVEETLVVHNFIGILTVMIPKTVLHDVGVFDESLLNSPDWDLWTRIVKKYRVGYIETPLAKYRFNPSGLSKNYKTYEKQLWKVLERHLLAGDYSSQLKKRGLWLYHRHMSHGFARNGNVVKSFENFLKTVRNKPMSPSNLLTLAYITLQLLKRFARTPVK
jgi:glycosyltransferase involved in cell wall biosynthesis